MDYEVISKKELLEMTGISYGQLYRWKRKKLIPEDWFIRRATFTGQETFFPREKILGRIAKIKDMKDDLSLDDLADVFSTNLAEVILQEQEMTDRGIVSQIAVDIYHEVMGDSSVFTFDNILYIYVLDRLLQAGDMNREEGGSLLRLLSEHFKKFAAPCDLVFIRKMGVSNFLLVSGENHLIFENGTKLVARLALAVCIEELKIKIGVS